MTLTQKLQNVKPLGGWKVLIMVTAVAWAFYAKDMGRINGTKTHATYLVLSLLYAYTVYGMIWLGFAAKNRVVARLEAKRGKKLNVHWKVYIVLSYAGMVGGMYLAERIIARVYGYPFDINKVWDSLFIANFVFLMFVFFMAFHKEKQRAAKLAAAHAEAELHVFKNQMQPHFLFNSLNSLTELMESNQKHASRMTQNLADLYREILDTSKKKMSSVDAELSIVRKYLELESLRFGGRLRYKIALQNLEAANQAYLPSLILQTLVENAVKHGISQAVDGGEISVSVRRENNGYVAEVVNSAADTGGPLPTNSLGMGLANTKSRLDLIYGDKHRFDLKVGGDVTRASFWFSGEAHA